MNFVKLFFIRMILTLSTLHRLSIDFCHPHMLTKKREKASYRAIKKKMFTAVPGKNLGA